MWQPKLSYALEREYPHKWFTWTAILGGIVLTAIFLTPNVAVTGYNLKVVYTTDFNETSSTKHWFDRSPFNIVDRPSTKCEPASLQVGQTMYTDKLALSYELEWVKQRYIGSDNDTTAPVIVYSSNPIQNCTLNVIEMIFESLEDRDALSLARAAWNPYLSEVVICQTVHDSTVTTFQLRANFDPTQTWPVLQVNHSSDPSLWWSWALLYVAKVRDDPHLPPF
ncbi:hypothetical protein E8E14_010083 [Neopestalotiopsis sp. 37M]|nr:hypothetical protein E8E14_010083 [Neopestalotiopsis sp. 37M]